MRVLDSNWREASKLLTAKKMRYLVNKAVYHILLICIRLLGLVPRRIGLILGKSLGRIAYFLDGRRRRIALKNLELAFPDGAQNEKIAREVFVNLGLSFFDLIYFYGAGPKILKKHVKVSGVSHYQRAKEKGRGVLLLSAHFGNWELMATIFALSSCPLSIIVNPIRFEPLNRVVEHLRASCGNRSINRKRSMRSLLRVLHQGETVGILLDQKVSWQLGVYVKFFDQPAFANKGMALVALKTGAAVVPIFMIRKNGHTYEVIIEPELELIRTGDKTKDIEENTALFTKIIERYVSNYPSQWLWMQNRWKKRPYQAWPRGYNPS